MPLLQKIADSLKKIGLVGTLVYTTLVKPHLEYCTQEWAPLPEHGNWEAILNLESIQRLTTKSIRGFNDLSYNFRLNEFQFTTLLEPRMRVDLIEAFKIVDGFPDYGRDRFTLFLALIT